MSLALASATIYSGLASAEPMFMISASGLVPQICSQMDQLYKLYHSFPGLGILFLNIDGLNTVTS